MCTVTIIPTRGGARLACNRDEQRTRPPARPPILRRFEERRAILPLDPQSDGTWIAVNDAGLAMTLLNVSSPPDRRPRFQPPWSRGRIIPTLLPCATLRQAMARAARMNPSLFAPFRLLLTDGTELAEVHSDGHQLKSSECRSLEGPELFTSSGLGDGLVEAPRRNLFMSCFAAGEPGTAQQDAYHRHAWPDYPHLSVFMRRLDAATVSVTAIQLGRDEVRMTYQPTFPDLPAEAVSAAMPLVKVPK
jgi:transport and Golgi organization protein 2